MPRYIDADVLLELIDEFEPENWTNSDRELQAEDDFELFRSLVKAEPTADVAEVKHGEWKKIDGDWREPSTGRPLTMHQCSCCGEPYQNAPYNYCPNCGAKMDGKGDSESEEIVLKQENFAELPVDKFTPELTPEEKALTKLWRGQGGRDELESVLRMFGAKTDGGQTE